MLQSKLRLFTIAALLALCLFVAIGGSAVRLITHWCLSLNGAGYASYVDDPALNMGVGDFAIGFWFRIFDTAAIRKEFVFKKSGADQGYTTLVAAATGYLQALLEDVDGNNAIVNGATDVRDGVWHHAFLACDLSGNGQWYLDGVADGSAVALSGITKSLDNVISFVIGATVTPSNYFPGYLALVELFYLGYGGLDPAEAEAYTEWRYANPYADLSKFADGAWGGLADAVRTAAGELVTNEDMENWTGDDLDNWEELFESAGVRDIVEEGTIKHGGSHSVKLEATLNDGTDFWISQLETLVPNEYYEVSFWYYYEARTVGDILLSIWNATDGNMILEIISATTGAWVNYREVIKPTVANSTIFLKLRSETTTGIVYYDDVSLQRVGNVLKCDMDGNLLDGTSNALHLTEGGTGNEFVGSTVRATRFEGGTGKGRFED